MVDITIPKPRSFRPDRRLLATITSDPQLIKYLENLGFDVSEGWEEIFAKLLELIINTIDVASMAQSTANQAIQRADLLEDALTLLDIPRTNEQRLQAYLQDLESRILELSGGGISVIGVSAPITSTGNQNPTIGINAATPSAAGSLSASDKTKLDSIASGAAVASVSGTAPIVSSGGTTPAISITAATGAAAGSMSATDKAKLDLLIYNATTWTPTLTFTTPGDLVVVYANRAATYTQVGRLVMLNWVIVTSTFTFTTATGNLSITGFPLTPAGFQVTCGKIEWQGITKAGYTEIAAEVAGGSPTIAFVASGSAQARSSVNQANVTSGTQITLIGSMMITV